jgi:hypothetical protein
MRVVSAALPLALLAFPAFAQDYTEEQKALIITTIAANGCLIDEAGAERLMPPLGITQPVFIAVTEDLDAAGQATLDDEAGTLTLAPEICP